MFLKLWFPFPSWFPFGPSPVLPPIVVDPPPGPPVAPLDTDYSLLESHMIQMINTERGKVGATPLIPNKYLSIAASKHSMWMITTGTFSHTGANGSTVMNRVQEAGYILSGAWTIGENIALASTKSPATFDDELLLLHNNLMNSPGHRANILNPNYREVGIGFEVGNYRGQQTAFVTQDFGKH